MPATIYRNRKVRVSPNDPLFPYCDTVTQLSNNLSNAVRFRQRQVTTAVNKEMSAWTANEAQVMREIHDALPLMGKEYHMPVKGTMSYTFLYQYLMKSANPDFLADGLPRQSAQQVVRQCVNDMDNFWKSLAAYREDPSRFVGKPELPGYKRKGGHCTCTITNQDAVLYGDTSWSLKLPLTKIRLDCGEAVPGASLKEVKIKPDNGTYLIILTLEVQASSSPCMADVPSRIAAVDFGVNNLIAVTNNCGLPCLLYKGGIVKSANRLYNKTIARIVSEQTITTGRKFVPTPEYMQVTRKRNDRISDFMQKTASHFVNWCVENRIDTIVCGVNRLWKQEVEIGSVNTQNFVQIPFSELQWQVRYRAEAAGILYVEQEESYTSKASFPDHDFIPVYGKEDEEPYFSGKRAPGHYKGRSRKGGFRGLYRTADGTIINSDLNGSANILRKAYHDAFKGCGLDFTLVKVIIHPDYDCRKQVWAQQKASAPGKPSHAKQKRLARKKNNKCFAA